MEGDMVMSSLTNGRNGTKFYHILVHVIPHPGWFGNIPSVPVYSGSHLSHIQDHIYPGIFRIISILVYSGSHLSWYIQDHIYPIFRIISILVYSGSYLSPRYLHSWVHICFPHFIENSSVGSVVVLIGGCGCIWE